MGSVVKSLHDFAVLCLVFTDIEVWSAGQVWWWGEMLTLYKKVTTLLCQPQCVL